MSRLPLALLLLLLIRTVLQSATQSYAETSLSRPTLQAIAWATAHTSANSRFLILNGAAWAVNDPAEWFPALTDRRSVDTIQGQEWLHGIFTRNFLQDQSLQLCVRRGPACIDRWVKRTGDRFDYLFVGRGAPPETGLWNSWDQSDFTWTLRTLLAEDPHYRPVFSNRAAVIYRWIS